MNTTAPLQIPLLNDAWSTFIGPFLTGPHRDIAWELINFLDKKGELILSVSDSPHKLDPDNLMKPAAFELLHRYTLPDHVARIIREAPKFIPPSKPILYNPFILAILGCELSRLPGSLNFHEYHPRDSAAIADRIIRDRLAPREKDIITTAISVYHVEVTTPDHLHAPLRKALMAARISELRDSDHNLEDLARMWSEIPILSPTSREYEYTSMVPPYYCLEDVSRLDITEIDLRWLNVSHFVTSLDAFIERCQYGDFAVATDHVVYFAPHTMYRVFRRYALRAGWIDVLIYDGHPFERQRLMKALVHKLFKAGVISGNYPSRGLFSVGRIVEFRSGKNQPMPLISCHISKFKRAGKAHMRHHKIRSIRPITPQG